MIYRLVITLMILLAISITPLAVREANAAIPFTPLPNSAVDAPVGSAQEANAPFLLPAGVSQQSLSSKTAANYLSQPKLGSWDMIAVNETGADMGRYLFVAHETSSNAGMSRYDRDTGTQVNLGFMSSWGAFDPALWTPWGTVITGEEFAGRGRFFEITNPLDDPATTPINFVERTAIANVSHEGVKFDSAGNLYYVDENSGGAIYKFASSQPNTPSALIQGQTFVLKDVDGSDGADVGAAVWEPLTDLVGNPLPGVTDPFTIVGGGSTRPGRTAANDVGATNYRRPEDLEISTLASGSEVLYVATTTTDEVFSIELVSNSSAFVREFVTNSTIDAATGMAVDMPGDIFENPDNLAIDADGNIYILEDSSTGDIWFAEDTDHDGVAERIARWASLGVVGAEPTGLFFDPFRTGVAYVNVQHPQSGNDRLVELTIVPEPAAWLLAMSGSLFVAACRRPRRLQHR